MESTTDYFWVVICKNRRFHHKGNTSYQHQMVAEQLGHASTAFSLDIYSHLPWAERRPLARRVG